MQTIETINTRAQRIADKIAALGFTKNEKPMVIDQAREIVAAEEGYRNWHTLHASIAKAPTTKPAQQEIEPCLTPENDDGNECTDFKLGESHRSCWISVDNMSIYIVRTEEGVIADIFAKGEEGCSPLASTYAFHTDAESALLGDHDIDDVAEWVGLHYRVNFDVESSARRLEWINRYKEAHTTEDSSPSAHNETKELI